MWALKVAEKFVSKQAKAGRHWIQDAEIPSKNPIALYDSNSFSDESVPDSDSLVMPFETPKGSFFVSTKEMALHQTSITHARTRYLARVFSSSAPSPQLTCCWSISRHLVSISQELELCLRKGKQRGQRY